MGPSSMSKTTYIASSRELGSGWASDPPEGGEAESSAHVRGGQGKRIFPRSSLDTTLLEEWSRREHDELPFSDARAARATARHVPPSLFEVKSRIRAVSALS